MNNNEIPKLNNNEAHELANEMKKKMKPGDHNYDEIMDQVITEQEITEKENKSNNKLNTFGEISFGDVNNQEKNFISDIIYSLAAELEKSVKFNNTDEIYWNIRFFPAQSPESAKKRIEKEIEDAGFHGSCYGLYEESTEKFEHLLGYNLSQEDKIILREMSEGEVKEEKAKEIAKPIIEDKYIDWLHTKANITLVYKDQEYTNIGIDYKGRLTTKYGGRMNMTDLIKSIIEKFNLDK